MCKCKCACEWCWNWNVFEDGVCSIGFDLYSSQEEGLRQHVHGRKFSCQGHLYNWRVRLTLFLSGSALKL